jgi:hypothetical protein
MHYLNSWVLIIKNPCLPIESLKALKKSGKLGVLNLNPNI